MESVKYYQFKKQAVNMLKYLVPTYASRCEISKNKNGYKVNVWWHSGEITSLTYQNATEVLGKSKC